MSDILLRDLPYPSQPAVQRRRAAAALLYLAAVALAEALTNNLLSASLGLLGHGVVLMALLLHAARTPDLPMRRLCLGLALAPLMRLVGLSLPLQNVPLVYWYPLVGAPLLLAALLVMRHAGMTTRQAGLTLNTWPLQLVLGASGLGLGYLEYLALRPAPWAAALSLSRLWMPALLLLVFSGFLEELVFRGVLQRLAGASLGRLAGLFYASALFAVLHLGYHSTPNLLLAFGAGLLFGAAALLTGSILGASLAHGLTNICLYLVFPLLLAASAPASGEALPSTAPERADQAPAGGALELLVDDGDDGFVHQGGQSWQVPQGSGGDLVWASASSQQASALAVWQVDILRCGRYRLEAFIPGDYATSRAAAYELLHRDGIQVVLVDQLASQGSWATLGELWLSAGQRARVSATNLTSEDDPTRLVAFDAVHWVLIEDCPAQLTNPKGGKP